MGTLNPLKTLICYECKTVIQDNIQLNEKEKPTNAQNDDEEEYKYQGWENTTSMHYTLACVLFHHIMVGY